VKWSAQTLLLASGLSLLLMGCQKQFVRPTPPERCPPIPDAGRGYDELEIWAGRMVDEYTRCAAKVDSLHE
jgi:hypothetical protein